MVTVVFLNRRHTALFLIFGDIQAFFYFQSINGSITTFQCQHGPKECAGNMFQGCVIDLMKGRASDLRIARYVACEMETEAGTRGDMTVIIFGLTLAAYRSIYCILADAYLWLRTSNGKKKEPL